MIEICSMCSKINIEDLKKALPNETIVDDCIEECGAEFTAYIDDDLITASSFEDFIEQCKNRDI